MTSELFDQTAMASAPSQLVLARRRLAGLIHQAEELADRKQEEGSVLETEDDRGLRRAVRDAEAIVRTEEAIEARRREEA